MDGNSTVLQHSHNPNFAGGMPGKRHDIRQIYKLREGQNQAKDDIYGGYRHHYRRHGGYANCRAACVWRDAPFSLGDDTTHPDVDCNCKHPSFAADNNPSRGWPVSGRDKPNRL